VQAKIAESRYRESPQSQDWAGHAVASVLKLNLSNKADKAKAASLLKMWIAKGALRVVEAQDEKRMVRKFIEAVPDKSQADDVLPHLN
jgi:hypothetical protein